MFLWAKLVMQSLADVDGKNELYSTITQMPEGLPELYAEIIKRISLRHGAHSMEKIYRILAWLVFAKRPLRRHEILHGAALTYDNPLLDEGNMLQGTAIEKCKPLIEEASDGTIGLVHSTAQE
jgi:hypothetical protein